MINVSGDGCTYGEGGNHFIHNIRRNPDITNIVHNNMVYGLNKGTSITNESKEISTHLYKLKEFLEPFNPLPLP